MAMRRTSTTVLAVVGEEADAVLDQLSQAPNVVVVRPSGDDALSRAVDAWSTAQGTHARWRVGSVELPDYYLVSAPEQLPATMRHWYLGVLHCSARARVAPVDAGASAVDAVRKLGPGPWWPPLDQMLAGIDRVVPDKVGLATG